MNKVQSFLKKTLGEVRVIVTRGRPWFVLADVIKVLGYSENTMTTDVARDLDKTEKDMAIIHTLGGPQKLATVSESGLYYLICTSRKPKAKEFRLWVTGTVLPAIRKTGGYIDGQEDLKAKDLAELEKTVAELSERVSSLTKENRSLNNEIVRAVLDNETLNEMLIGIKKGSSIHKLLYPNEEDYPW